MRASSAATLGLFGALACGESGPNPTGDLVFENPALDLGIARDTVFELRNEGTIPYGPIFISALPITTVDGAAASGSSVRPTPEEIATLNPGASRLIRIEITSDGGLGDGQYRSRLDASLLVEGTVASTALTFEVNDEALAAAAAAVELTVASTMRQGDVTDVAVEVRDRAGAVIDDATVSWSTTPAAAGAVIDRRFVAYGTGPVLLIARVGSVADTAAIDVIARSVSSTMMVDGTGAVAGRFTSDLWVRGDVAYTGTWGIRATAGGALTGNTLYVWDLSTPASPRLTDSVRVDARVVNDVKIHPTEPVAVITHEASLDGSNGVTLLDLSDPLSPVVITRFTETLRTGVHNAWLEGAFLYLVVDGTAPTSGLRVLDISDPTAPRVVADYYAGSSFLHDVYVRDGLAFLSHWNAGLVILDVGRGDAGGAPTAPVEVGRILTEGGQTHNAWYWPARGYVFVGEEDFSTPGRMHVIDVNDPTRPREIATFRVVGDTPHNFWLDEVNEVLYLAWYTNGLQAVDVSGSLLGELDRQGRVIATIRYSSRGGCAIDLGVGTCTWAPQLAGDRIWVSDMNTGLWSLIPPS